jgi:hypothetical protein
MFATIQKGFIHFVESDPLYQFSDQLHISFQYKGKRALQSSTGKTDHLLAVGESSRTEILKQKNGEASGKTEAIGRSIRQPGKATS